MNNLTSSQFSQFQTPPPPGVYFENVEPITSEPMHCLKCGSTSNVALQRFTKKYVSPVAGLGIFLGGFPYFLLRLLLTTTHELTAPFCGACWKGKFEILPKLAMLSNLGFLLSIFVALVFAIYLRSAFATISMFLVAVGVIAFRKAYEWQVSPRFLKIDSKQVIIDAPVVGEVVFSK
jgi:hypothetical protein